MTKLSRSALKPPAAGPAPPAAAAAAPPPRHRRRRPPPVPCRSRQRCGSADRERAAEEQDRPERVGDDAVDADPSVATSHSGHRGRRYTPVTEITSLSTAGSDMPLTSPSGRVVGVVVAHVDCVVAPVPPVVGCWSEPREPPAERRTPGGGDRRDPFLEELVIRLLERDHELRDSSCTHRLRSANVWVVAEGERGRDHAVDLARPERVVHERVLDRRSAARCRAGRMKSWRWTCHSS